MTAQSDRDRIVRQALHAHRYRDFGCSSDGRCRYGALYGSHGERDYMRKVAADALNPEQAEPKCIGFSGCHDGKHDWSCPVEDE